MDTYLKLASVKKNKTCNCISPFYIHDITGINPNTGRNYSSEDRDILKTALYRISAAKGCNITSCCDPNDPTAMPDQTFTKNFISKYPKIMPIYEGSQLKYIKLSTSNDVKESGWIEPTPYFICKITKATIQNTKDSTIQLAVKLVNDCFTDSCSNIETITVQNLLGNSKAEMKYTGFDDARVSQSILEGNISYVKEYIRKYKEINMPLTTNDYRNRMIHLASESNRSDILTMLIALKANLNIQNKLGETPIHFAIRAKNLDNISILLTQGVDLTIPTLKGETAMFYAMATGDMRVINMLYTNNSPILGVDSQGNNLIHYCILNCPSFKEDDTSVPNTKSEIIQWLIDHGISTSQKNAKGITPLELVSRQINKEVNKECALTNKKDQETVIEKFFGGSGGSGGSNGATEQNLDNYTDEHLSLLDIQTKLFNNIIRNNPKKYNRYINVSELPKGSPIEVLDTVCVGGVNLTGNEDSDECIAKGGKVVKVKNKTTKIKLELTPQEESATDKVNQRDLYLKKNPQHIPKNTIPANIIEYNASVMQGIPQTTAGITYPIATGSNNMIESSTPATTLASNQEVQDNKSVSESNHITTNQEEHASILDENNQIVRKCKQDAMTNTEKFANISIHGQNGQKESFSTRSSFVLMKIQNMNYNQILLILLLLLMIIGIVFLITPTEKKNENSKQSV